MHTSLELNTDGGGGDTAEFLDRLTATAPNFHGRKGKRKGSGHLGKSNKEARTQTTEKQAAGAAEKTTNPWDNFREDGYHLPRGDSSEILESTHLPGTSLPHTDQQLQQQQQGLQQSSVLNEEKKLTKRRPHRPISRKTVTHSTCQSSISSVSYQFSLSPSHCSSFLTLLSPRQISSSENCMPQTQGTEGGQAGRKDTTSKPWKGKSTTCPPSSNRPLVKKIPLRKFRTFRFTFPLTFPLHFACFTTIKLSLKPDSVGDPLQKYRGPLHYNSIGPGTVGSGRVHSPPTDCDRPFPVGRPSTAQDFRRGCHRLRTHAKRGVLHLFLSMLWEDFTILLFPSYLFSGTSYFKCLCGSMGSLCSPFQLLSRPCWAASFEGSMGHAHKPTQETTGWQTSFYSSRRTSSETQRLGGGTSTGVSCKTGTSPTSFPVLPTFQPFSYPQAP